MTRGGLACVALAGAFCACGHVARISDLSSDVTAQLESARAAQNLEKARPEEAASRYRAILAKVVVYKPQSDYRQELATDIQEAANTGAYTAVSKASDFTSDSSLGIPHVYDEAVETEALAEVGMARLLAAKSDPAAWSWAVKALALAETRALSPLTRERIEGPCYAALSAIYAKQGKPGLSKLADLDQALAQDFLESQTASLARAQDEEVEKADRELTNRLDRFAGNVNSERTQFVAEVLLQAAQLVAGSMNQAPGAAYGKLPGMTGSRAVMFNMERQMLGLGGSGQAGGDAAGLLLGPLPGGTMMQQLASPQYGAKAPSLIKAFASTVAGLSGDAGVKQAAEQVGDSVDAVLDARRSPQGLEGALAQFSRSFQALQTNLAESSAH